MILLDSIKCAVFNVEPATKRQGPYAQWRESLTIFAACEEEKGEEREREIQTKMGKGIFLFLSLQKGNKLFFFLFLQMSSRKEPSEFAEHHIQGSHFVVPRRYSNLQALGALSFPFPFFFFSFSFLFFFFWRECLFFALRFTRDGFAGPRVQRQ